MNDSASLALFIRPPVPGFAKTRLAPVLGADGAARLQRAFVHDSIAICKSARVGVVLWVSDAHMDEATEEWLKGLGLPLHEQPAGDLGVRIAFALEHAIASQGTGLVLGSDSPTLAAAVIRQAFDALSRSDMVLGPAHDGGYYLIGVRSNVPSFEGVRWSSPYALRDTLTANSTLSTHLLSPWYDVDTPQDLGLLRMHLTLDPSLAPATRALLL